MVNHIITKADITITTTMITGATQMQKLAPGLICRGATTRERPGLKAILMTVEEAMAEITTIGTVDKRKSVMLFI
jgi:hypothetical protein